MSKPDDFDLLLEAARSAAEKYLVQYNKEHPIN